MLFSLLLAQIKLCYWVVHLKINRKKQPPQGERGNQKTSMKGEWGCYPWEMDIEKNVHVCDNSMVDLLPSWYRSLFGQTISGISPRLNSPPPSPPRATPQISRLYCIASDNRIFYWFLFLVLHTHNYHSLLWLDLTKRKLSLDNCRLNLPKNDGSQTKWKRWIGDTRTGKNGIGTQWS